MRPDAQQPKRGKRKRFTDAAEAALERKEAEELRGIAVTVLKSNDVSVTRDDDAPTSFTDAHGAIVVTDQIIPKELRDKLKAVRRVMDGEVLHEAGHNILTRAIEEEGKKFRERNHGLGQYTFNLYEDKRVNHFVEGRYTYDDYSNRLKYLRDLIGQCWHYTAQEQLKAGQIQPGQFFISAAGMSILYEQDVSDLVDELAKRKAFQKTAMEKDLEELHSIAKDYRFIRTERKASELLERAAVIMKRYAADMPEILIPKAMHGKGDLRVPGSLATKVEGDEHGDDEGDDEDGQADDGCDELHRHHSTSRGLGDGLEIPAPPSDHLAYQRVRDSVEPQVQRLLNLLKKVMQVRSHKVDWQRSGRIMYPVLPMALAASNFAPVENIYTKTVQTIERQKCAICLLVDLSGSMDQVEAQRVLAVITEVCGRWLRDEDFSCLVFGSNFARLKVFVEAYHNTRARIGGLHDYGGTMALPPTIACHKMMRSINHGRKKVFVFVSDFGIEPPNEMQKEWTRMRESGIEVLGIGLGADPRYARQYLGAAVKCIGNVNDLPETFFELYRERVAFGQVRPKKG